ncbi:MAG: hypothetical protein WAM79_01940 [Candidatus Sulfotelmatobacter sp.]
MPHPDGGRGSKFKTRSTFKQAYKAVSDGFNFLSTKDKPTKARVSVTRDGAKGISFFMEDGSRGCNVCESCWGFRRNCSDTRIGQWVEGLNRSLASLKL